MNSNQMTKNFKKEDFITAYAVVSYALFQLETLKNFAQIETPCTIDGWVLDERSAKSLAVARDIIANKIAFEEGKMYGDKLISDNLK